MRQLVVRVRDKVNRTDLMRHSMLTKRGDVIDVFRDDYQISGKALTATFWIIIRVEVSELEAREMLAGTFKQNGDRQEEVRRREFMFRLGDLPERVRGHAADNDTRTAEFIDISAEEMRAIRVRKPTWEDPRAIG